MEVIDFFQNLGIAFIIVLLIAGVCYWVYFVLKKSKPNLKYWFMYNLFGKKYNEKEVTQLMDYAQANLSINQVKKFLLIKGQINPKRVNELCYIYEKIKSNGGIKK